jgi:hypothetical protein
MSQCRNLSLIIDDSVSGASFRGCHGPYRDGGLDTVTKWFVTAWLEVPSSLSSLRLALWATIRQRAERSCEKIVPILVTKRFSTCC